MCRLRQTPAIQSAHKTVETPQIQFIGSVVDVPVMAQRQVLSVQSVQKMVEVPQIHFIDKSVDAPVNMQRQITGQEQIDAGVNLNISGAITPHRWRKGSGIFHSHRLKAGMKEKAYDDGHDHETLHVSTASADEMEDEVEMESID